MDCSQNWNLSRARTATPAPSSGGSLGPKPPASFFCRFPDPIFIFSMDGELVYRNDAAASLIGRITFSGDVSEDESRQRLSIQSGSGDFLQEALRMAEGEIKDVPVHFSLGENVSLPFLATSSPLLDTAGQTEGCLILLRETPPSPVATASFSDPMGTFSSVLQNFPTPFFTVDTNLRFTYVNKPFERLTGFKKEELLHRKTCAEVLCTSECNTDECLLLQAMQANKQLAESRRTFFAPDGRQIPVVVCASTINDMENNVVGAFEVIRDISRFVESEKKIEFVTEITHEGILLIDEEFHIIFANPQMAELLRVTREELLAMDVGKILPVQQQAMIADLIKTVDKKGSVDLRFCTTLQPIGESTQDYRAFETRIAVSRIGRNVLTCICFLDISSRVEIERQLRNTNSFLNNIIRSSVDGIVVTDTDGNVLIFNEGAENILGFTAEEVISVPRALRLMCPTEVARENMRRMRSNEFGPPGKLNSTPITFYNKAGEPVPVNFSAAIIQEGGRELGSVGIFSDLREHMRMRRELEEARHQLIQSEKIASLGRLAAGVAHEINNPLAGILIYADMLLKDAGTNQQWKEDLEEIITQTLRCKQIVTRLLDFSRQSLGQKIPYMPNDAIERCVALLAKQTLFHDIEIVRNLREDLPQLVGDPSAMQQVFTNLLINAADAMQGKGRITISSAYDEQSEAVVIQFADTGPGISPDVLNKIFEPFFTTKRPGEGTGLGLSVAYGLVKQHGGKLEARNDCTGGALFTITLPLIFEEVTSGDECMEC